MPEEYHLTPQTYFRVLVALLILLIITVLLAFLDLGRDWGFVLGMGIAAGKGILIILYFMHLKTSPRSTSLYAVAGFLWLGILVVLTSADYLTRNHPPQLNYKGEPRYLMEQK